VLREDREFVPENREQIEIPRRRVRLALLVRVRLSSQGRRLLARSRSRTMRVVVSVVPRGAARPAARRTVTLRAVRGG